MMVTLRGRKVNYTGYVKDKVLKHQANSKNAQF